MDHSFTFLEDHIRAGMSVLVRLDGNVPVRDGAVSGDFRLKKVLPTVLTLVNAGARVVVVSHIENDEGSTLKPVAEYLRTHVRVHFVPSVAEAIRFRAEGGHMDGEVVVVENLRNDPREKENDESFARELSSLGDVFVNEAFSASHREHASISSVPNFLPSFFGSRFAREVREISVAFDPERPFLFVLGGAKFETKIPLIEKFLDRADRIFVGGALAHNFFKELGWEIGRSRFSDGDFSINDLLSRDNLIFPKDVVVETEDGQTLVKSPRDVLETDTIYDSGPDTIASLEKEVTRSRTVLWNGPLGDYEKGFDEHTRELARFVAHDDSHSLIGGGDTVASIEELGLEERFSFVSTGGGAMLDFLVNETLPGIEAIRRSSVIIE